MCQMNRQTEFDCQQVFVERWSPRALVDDVSDEDLMKLFEAAKWAPSSYNQQPWRFIYAKNGSENWNNFFNLLAEPNQTWCKNASYLVVVVSQDNFEHNDKPSRTSAFCTGNAFMNLSIEAQMDGIVVHGMEGFDYEKAKTELEIPEGYTVQAMFAVGRQGDKSILPEEVRKMEEPSDRKKIKELVFEGKFGGKK